MDEEGFVAAAPAPFSLLPGGGERGGGGGKFLSPWGGFGCLVSGVGWADSRSKWAVLFIFRQGHSRIQVEMGIAVDLTVWALKNPGRNGYCCLFFRMGTQESRSKWVLLFFFFFFGAG